MNAGAGLQITPLILTYNEEPNIARTLESLGWAKRVVVLDSGSTDATEEIARSFANVAWFVRPFDNHKAQWEYGIRETGIGSDYVLALDADMSVSQSFAQEAEADFLPHNFVGGITSFQYRILNRPLLGSIYPSQLRVFNRKEIRVEQSGHTQEFYITGKIYHFKSLLIHDDRKALERWTSSQLSYSLLELNRLHGGWPSRLQDRLRKLGIMPPIAGVLAYLRAGGPFRGAAALRYAYERATYECLLSIRLMSKRLEDSENSDIE
jgi:glycosyltransferase involved in cell wall biosynthesis